MTLIKRELSIPKNHVGIRVKWVPGGSILHHGPLRRLGSTRWLFLSLLFLVHEVAAGELVGRVVAVADGDTITVLVSRQQIKVRLLDIDAPKKKQAFGTRSRQSLAELCAGKEAQVFWENKDRYGRTLGRVYCAGSDANAEQVARGLAWVFVRYAPKDSPLFDLEQSARLGKRGLWADHKAVPPWEWRRMMSSN